MTLWSALSAEARDALAAALPGGNLGRPRAIGEGWGAAAFRVSDPTGDWSVRLPRPEAPWAIADLERETRLLPLLVGRIASVETPHDAAIVRDADGGFVAAVHRFVEGTPPFEHRLRGAVRTRLADQIGAFLQELHATPRTAAKRHGVRQLDLWPGRYLQMIADTLPHLGPAGRRWLQTQARAFARGGGTSKAPRVLIHGDIAGAHLLLDRASKLRGVIDFGDAMVADPALDFAGVLNDFSWAFLERVLAAYEAAGGAVDADARRRVGFYIDVSPIFQVVYGDRVRGGAERGAGVRRITARAAAASR
jgi:aminoglycoside phosphotransferase (APT) family kinase protein